MTPDRHPFILENFTRLLQTPADVDRLNAFILSLAIQGKLVPQDPNETSPLRMLSVFKPKIKPILPDQYLFSIPHNWVWLTINDIGDVVGGGTPSTSNHEYWDPAEIPWLTPADIRFIHGKYASVGKRSISHKGLENSSAKILPPGSVILSSRAPIGYVKIAENSIATNQGFKSIVPFDVRFSDYIYYYLLSCTDLLISNASGTTFLEISGSKFKSIPIPLPPLEEQHRIVARVEQLFAQTALLKQKLQTRQQMQTTLITTAHQRLAAPAPVGAEKRSISARPLHSPADDNAIPEWTDPWHFLRDNFAALTPTPASVKQLRQTILSLAIQGKLVPQSIYEDLICISQPIHIFSKNKFKYSQSVLATNFNLKSYSQPNTWLLCTISDIAFVRGGKRIPKGYGFSSIPTDHIYIRVTDMKDGSIIDNDLRYIDEFTFNLIGNYTISSNDLYITIAGTIGQVGEVPSKFDNMSLTENAAKLVFDSIDKKWFQYTLMSQFVQDQFSEKTNKLAQPKLALERIRNTIIPLPPLEEQHRIVARVEQLFTLCDQLEAKLTLSHTTQSTLTQTVFSGG